MLFEEMISKGSSQPAYAADSITLHLHGSTHGSGSKNPLKFTYLEEFLKLEMFNHLTENVELKASEYLEKIKVKFREELHGQMKTISTGVIQEFSNNMPKFLLTMFSAELMMYLKNNKNTIALKAYSNNILLKHFGINTHLIDPITYMNTNNIGHSKLSSYA